jgi:hypothetical protein
MTGTSQDTTHDSNKANEATSVGGKYEVRTKTVPMVVRMERSQDTTSPRRNVTGTLHIEIKKLEQRLFEAGSKKKVSVCCLEMANAMGRIKDDIQEHTEREITRNIAAFVAHGRST